MNPRHRRLVGAALALFSQLAAAEVSPLRAMAAGCANCHGTQGVALEGMETLAGQKKDELVRKLLDFKSGKKPATVMQQLAKGYSDEQLEQLAGYFAALRK